MWARSEAPDPHLLANIGRFVVPAALVTAGFGVGIYALHYTDMLEGPSASDAPASFVQAFEEWTGVSADDAGFQEAVATVAAQTALSTFVSYAAFLLILFLKPPSRLFAAWTRPDGDKRPAGLVAVLVLAFSGLLFVPWFTDYFGLTEAAEPVFETVLPALVLWFLVLTAVYRLRLLDRVLGLDLLEESGGSRR